MARHCVMKSKQKKRKREKYDREDEPIAVEKKVEISQSKEDELSITPSDRKPGVIFILEGASLEVAKVGKSYQLLNEKDHAGFLERNNKKPDMYRPDICHRALLSILDSTIAKAGRLRAVYVKTEQGNLIEVNPKERIPRTFKRFSGLMLQLLQKLRITAGEKLFRVVKNPVTQYLPADARKIGLSYSSEKLVRIQDYVDTVGNDTDLVFVVGANAMADGKIKMDYTDDYIAVSRYQLSAAYCISSICLALADKWDIL